jgi:hypothetical protein
VSSNLSTFEHLPVASLIEAQAALRPPLAANATQQEEDGVVEAVFRR